MLICTYEKAEALMRFLGPLFLHRVMLVVVDEAHQVQFDGTLSSLLSAENRSFRLESLGARLLSHLSEDQSRVVALSAVASGTEKALANWVTGSDDAEAVATAYRSTRQLVGRLECLPDRRFFIRYDMLDGSSLQFSEANQGDGPFVPDPFPQYPPTPSFDGAGPEKSLRPYLFWAAMSLAAPDASGRQRSVLVSVSEHVDWYAADLLDLLDNAWAGLAPAFFQQPTSPERIEILEKCLRSCADYFGTDSREYRLLQKGIGIHHGKMPGLMARLLVEAIEEHVVHLVVATSTLSEGVNLPFEVVLVPSLFRSTGQGASESGGQNRRAISVREFGNLIGRAGRPGVSSEGRTLVLIDKRVTSSRLTWAESAYFNLVRGLQRQAGASSEQIEAKSPLAELLRHIEAQWRCISRQVAPNEFFQWLERTAPINSSDNTSTVDGATNALDSLDAFLLSAIVEAEGLAGEELSLVDLEERLQRLWQRTYARYASNEEARLGAFFVRRGRALKETIYPEAAERRRLYRTSLPPRSAKHLLDAYQSIKGHLESGGDYGVWSQTEKFDYIRALVELLSALPMFRTGRTPSRGNVAWQDILHWWLAPRGALRTPTSAQVTQWYDYVSKYYAYRFNWGLGSVLALAIDEAYQGELTIPALQDWPTTGLPWIVFWLKELIVWGTLEPVAAYLLAKGKEVTRDDAEGTARLYYSEQPVGTFANDLLNASTIRDWVLARAGDTETKATPLPPKRMDVTLLRDFQGTGTREFRVVPVVVPREIQWLDPAGFPLAKCPRPAAWRHHFLTNFDFVLDASSKTVSSKPYL